MELTVGIMLLLLGAMNLRKFLRDGSRMAERQLGNPPARRPLMVGIVHGLAGSAAIALLVLGAVRDALWGIAYLVVFGVGTVAGMLLITMAMATLMVVAVRRSERVHRTLGVATGLASVVFGAVLVYEIGFVHGLFTSQPSWLPR